MARSSIADRYLRTLENHAEEVKPKSPPRSVKHAAESPVKADQPTRSPLKSSPVKNSAAPKTVPAASPAAFTSPVKYEKPLSAAKSSAKIEIGRPPDRNPTMHNQDLTPSEVAWDKERKNWQAYEYLCHVAEAKEWMEKILKERLPDVAEFPESLQNGVALAKIMQTLRPDLMQWPIFEHKRLQYRHTENITQFFVLLDALKIPQLFLFDMTDLYEKRNLPKVIYCIHAISHYVAETQSQVTAVDNLVGKLEFNEAQLTSTERGLKGHAMPNFGNVRKISGKYNTKAVESTEPRIESLEIAGADDDYSGRNKASYGDDSFEYDRSYDRDEHRDYRSSDRDDRSRSDRYDRYDRNDRYRSDSSDRYDDRSDRYADRSDRYADRSDRYDDRSGRNDPYRSDRSNRNDRSDRSDRYRSDRNDRSRNDRSDRHSNRYDGLSPPKTRYAREYEDSASDEDMDDLKIRPPRRYRNRDQYRDRVDSFTASTRKVSRDMYYRRYNAQSDRQTMRGYGGGYRDLSSTGSLRSRVLTSAEKMLIELESLEPEIVQFLAICRGALVRRSLHNQPGGELWGRPLQAAYRNQFARVGSKARELGPARAELAPTGVVQISRLQAIIRGEHVRKTLVHKLDSRQLESLVQFQALVRAKAVRRSFTATAAGASNLVPCQSLARGVLARRRLAAFKEQLAAKDSVKSVVHVQSKFRGDAARRQLSQLFSKLDSELPSIVALQALCRRRLIESRHRRCVQSWHDHTDQIVLVQSYWRAAAQGSKYRMLVTGSKPNLEAIRPFLQLIDDKPEDFQMELELETIMKEISAAVKRNEQLETVIEQLDMKIALLVKNNISIDENVLKQQRQNERLREESHVAKPSKAAHRDRDEGARDAGLKEKFDLKTLQKASRDRIELYQGLFYIMQTRPVYISRLMTLRAPRSLDVAELVLSVFGNGETRREMFFLLRQLAESITQSTVGSAENTNAWCIIAHLNHRQEARELAARVLAPAAEKLKTMSDTLLEYDPHHIYEHLTGGGDLSAEEAIQEQAVQAVFVQNLHKLREVTMILVQSIAQHITAFPYHVRYIAREVYREVLKASEDHHEAMAAVGQVVISQFLQPELINADSLDLVDAAIGKTAKNLSLVGKVLHQVGLMAPFTAAGGTDIYLQPLNDFVRSRAHVLTQCFQKAIVEAPDLEQYFGISDFDDITMHERPLLTISMDHILALHYMCYNNASVVVTQDDEVLKPVIDRLGPLPRDAREMLDLARFKELTLELNPKYCASAALKDSNSGVSSLFATAKRCLGYVLRVQSNQPDVMSVLVAPVELEDEHRYNLLLDADNTREVAGDLATLTFRDLKAWTLEVVLELESSGHVTRENDYQVLINAIAEDIRNKDVVRQRRASTLKARKQTLASVQEKGMFLQQRVDTYSTHINEAMTALQVEAAQSLNAPRNKRFQFQLTGPKQPTPAENTGALYGSYRVSADKLYEKSILIRLRGYSDRERKDIYFTFSSHEILQFQMDILSKNVLLPNGSIKFSLDDLLSHQYRNDMHVEFMSGNIQFSTNRLLQLILSKFLGTSM